MCCGCGAEVRRQLLSLNPERVGGDSFRPRLRYGKARMRNKARESKGSMVFISLVFLEHRNWNGWHGLPARALEIEHL